MEQRQNDKDGKMGEELSRQDFLRAAGIAGSAWRGWAP